MKVDMLIISNTSITLPLAFLSILKITIAKTTKQITKTLLIQRIR